VICDHGRCWREAQVFIPGTPLAFCSAHALVGLGTWPTVRYAELESNFRTSGTRPPEAAAPVTRPLADAGGGRPSSDMASPAPLSFEEFCDTVGWDLVDMEIALIPTLEGL
jgi:hypothetical protein